MEAAMSTRPVPPIPVTSTAPSIKHFPLSYNQIFGYIFGLVYLAVGAAGYASTKGINLTATLGGRELHWFSVNPLHNIVHLVIGGLWIIAAFTGPSLARGVNIIVGSAYLLLAIVGPFVSGTSANILGLNLADDLLHVVTALTALTVAFVLGSHDELQRA
jgi:hypothetical protein